MISSIHHHYYILIFTFNKRRTTLRKENGFNQDQKNLAHLLANQVPKIRYKLYSSCYKILTSLNESTTLYRSILIPSNIYPLPPLPLYPPPQKKSLRICMNLMGGPGRGLGARAPARPPWLRHCSYLSDVLINFHV